MQEPFERNAIVDKPGIVGARWWHAALADRTAQIKRRDAIRNILIVGGIVAGFGALLAVCVKAVSSDDGGLPDDAKEQRNVALAMQKEYGWSFGAVGEALVFDGLTTKPFQPGALMSLADDLGPARADLAPFNLTTLFQSPYAMPTSLAKLPPEERLGFRPLHQALRPIYTPAMADAYRKGKSIASLFASLSENGDGPADAKAALVVDLPGPAAVAFAAGAASVFDPVFLFDNWPHPRGVVKSHQTLAAAAYYQPLFAAAKRAPQIANVTEGGAIVTKSKRPPMFVVDSTRLTPYADDVTQFDNRYVAKLPSAAQLKSAGVERVLYVAASNAHALRENDDVNDDFVGFTRSGTEVKSVSLDMFAKDASAIYEMGSDAGSADKPSPAKVETDRLVSDSEGTYYGGSSRSHHAFFADYPWAKPARPATARPTSNPGRSWTPTARRSPYSSGSSSPPASRPRPTNFATIPVVVAVGTGVVLGARYSRNGSWNRSSGSSGS